MANPPPQAGKIAPERPLPALIETRKSSPKTGLLPAVCRRFPDGSTAVPTTVSRRFRRRFDDSLPTARPPRSGPVRLRGSTLFRKKLSGNSVHTFKPTNPAYGKRKVSAGTWSPGKKRCRQEPNAPGGSSGGPDSRPGCLGGHNPRNVPKQAILDREMRTLRSMTT